jgi:hypothetical protein
MITNWATSQDSKIKHHIKLLILLVVSWKPLVLDKVFLNNWKLQFIFETDSFFYFEIFKKMELQSFINSNNSPRLVRTSVGGLLDSNKFRFMLQVRF